jgi:hypothetical protein
MKNKLLLLIFAVLLISGCEKDECLCGKVVDKSELHLGKDTRYLIEVENTCSGNVKLISEKGYVYLDIEIGTIYCLDYSW